MMMKTTTLAIAALLGSAVALPAFAQTNTPTAGDVLGVQRGQGSAVTGSSELAGKPIGTRSTSSPTAVLRAEPVNMGGPSAGDALGVRRGQGSAVTGSSELAKQPIGIETYKPSRPPEMEIGTGPYVGGGQTGTNAQAERPQTAGEVLGVQPGQGSAVTQASELPRTKFMN